MKRIFYRSALDPSVRRAAAFILASRGCLDIQSSISHGNELRRLAFAPHLTIMAGCRGGVGWVRVASAGRRGRYANDGCAFFDASRRGLRRQCDYSPPPLASLCPRVSLHLCPPSSSRSVPFTVDLPAYPPKPSCFIFPPVLLCYYTPPSPSVSRNMRCICFPPPPGLREWDARRRKSADALLCGAGKGGG